MYLWFLHVTKEGWGKAVTAARLFFLLPEKFFPVWSLIWIRGAPRRGGSQGGSPGWMNHPVGSFEAQILLEEGGLFCFE